ncbi:MAG: cellulase family glycosylhydrolase [Clostridia bacterium]|nr:cellulase family glycosylhydrolase [Clostridia bacterium]
MKDFKLRRGMGIGGWLTNYKRFNVLPIDKRLDITIGDIEHFESYITEKDIKYIAETGFDHIRLGFDQIVLEKSPYEYRELTVYLVESFVSWCHKYNLTPILNLHKAIGNYCDIEEEVGLLDSTELQDRFIALWLMLEKRFSKDPGVYFELLNEVRDVDPELWNDLAEKTINKIREINKERVIIVGTTNWNNVWRLDKLRLYDDENIIYTFHMYDPSEFTHQRGVLHANQLYYNRVMHYPDDIEKFREYYRLSFNNNNAYQGFDIMDKKYMSHILSPAKEFVKKHPDKCLWCGEFGTIRHADIRSRENWMRDVISILKEDNIPYCVWNYLSTPNDGNRFSLVDDDTRKILTKELEKILLGEI